MAITVANLITNLDTYIGDTSTDRISEAERFQALTEATVWLQEELENELQNATYSLDYWDTVNYYKVTTAVADLLESADLRREKDLQIRSFAHKSARELAEEIGQGASESSWTVERRDTDTFLVINHSSQFGAKTIADFDSLSSGGGTWSLDATNGDGINLTVDTTERKQGTASLNFDADVSQSGNNKIEIVNTTLNKVDLGSLEDISTWLFQAYIPDVTNFSGFTLYWGSDTSNYWSATVTTDIDGSAWANRWNRVKVDWVDATKTSSPLVAEIDYLQIDFNYSGGQGDDTDFRIDDLIIVRPESLTYHYLSWNVGTSTGGADITVFAATTDIPYFSGQYDQYKYTVAHRAASILFRALRLRDEAQFEDNEADEAMRRVKSIHPSSKISEVKSFKVAGVRFNKRN